MITLLVGLVTDTDLSQQTVIPKRAGVIFVLLSIPFCMCSPVFTPCAVPMVVGGRIEHEGKGGCNAE